MKRWVILGAVPVAVAIGLLVGSVDLATADVVEALVRPAAADPVTVRIVHLRLARVALGLVVGAGLAVAGAAFQTLLGNPLATPYTVGVAAAGSFGGFLALAVPGVAGLGLLGTVPVQAGVWAAVELVLLTSLARRTRWGGAGLILAGVTFNFLFAAGTMLLRLLADPFRLHAMERWLLGGLDIVGWRPAVTAAALAAPGVIVLLSSASALDQIAFGDAAAHGRGVRVSRVRLVVLVAGAWITAACVAHTGPIAFVGLVVPHTVRRLVGYSHREVLALNVAAGGAFLVLSDVVARTLPVLGRGAELPVGVVTALVGGPLFLVLLARTAQGRG